MGIDVALAVHMAARSGADVDFQVRVGDGIAPGTRVAVVATDSVVEPFDRSERGAAPDRQAGDSGIGCLVAPREATEEPPSDVPKCPCVVGSLAETRLTIAAMVCSTFSSW